MFKALTGTTNNRIQPLKIIFSSRCGDLLFDEFKLFIVIITNRQDLVLLSSFYVFINFLNFYIICYKRDFENPGL
ncbi:MAG: hypothetical protein CMI64_15365 [Pedosphaera sp.]|nr:hypothetical protein [Pedosphaera sp.]